MQINNLIDNINLTCISGDGGDGGIYFNRSSANSKGGPNGGNGGNGGSVFVIGNKTIKGLNHIKKYKNFAKAESGFPGGKFCKNGKRGRNIIIELPLGTFIYSDSKFISKILDDKNLICILKGGKGGKGNFFLRNSKNRTPYISHKGKKGLQMICNFELKILSDISIIGLPNAGKSTLLSTLSNATPEINDYPFTTINPVFGVIKYDNDFRLTISEIPGIISDASLGKGRGIKFLKHVERTSFLIFLLSAESKNIKKEYNLLLKEIKNYNAKILNIPYIIVVNKCDLIKNLKNKTTNVDAYISAKKNYNIQLLKNILYEKLKKIILPYFPR
ncbi:MAG: GTPase ObgE [Bacteroides sp.]|nr:MAG: GTPase ObgE [Bacteroides sp.]